MEWSVVYEVSPHGYQVFTKQGIRIVDKYESPPLYGDFGLICAMARDKALEMAANRKIPETSVRREKPSPD